MPERIPQMPAAEVNPFRSERTSFVPPTKSERTAPMRVPPKNLREAIVELTPHDKKIRFLAKGGEQLVLEYEGRSSVYKVNFKKTAQAGYDTGFDPDWMREELNVQRRALDEDNALLRTYFGYAAVPASQSRVEDVPFSEEAMTFLGAGLLKDFMPSRPKTIPALVTIQRKLDLREAVSLTGYYPEVETSEFRRSTQEVPEEEWMRTYELGNELLVSPANSGERYEEDVELALELYPDLSKTVLLAYEDRTFRDRLKDAVRKMIAFMKETGKVLDLAGGKNVCLLKEGDGWELRMPDALHGDAILLSELQRIQEDARAGKELARSDMFEALNAINTVRVVNALALIAGINDRLVVSGLNRIPGDVWLRELQPVMTD